MLHFQALAVGTHGCARVAAARRQRAWRDVALVVRAALAAIAGLRATCAVGSALSPATLVRCINGSTTSKAAPIETTS